MSNGQFEIEEELDFSLLGVEPEGIKHQSVDASLDVAKSIVMEAEKAIHPPPYEACNSRTALDLLRDIVGLYTSADWTPVSKHDSPHHSELLPFNIVKQIESLPTEVTSDEQPALISHDFAEMTPSIEGNITEVALCGQSMEKTESYVSTTPSAVQDHSQRPRPRVTWVRTRLPGRRRYRTGIRVHRVPTPLLEDIAGEPLDNTDTASQISAPSRPEPTTRFQRDFSDTFGRDTLDKLEHQAKLDSTSGHAFPPVVREIFPLLADTQSVLRIANVIRRHFELPLLNNTNKSEKIALRRALAKMRENLYTEMVAALALPLAPKPGETDDEEDKEQKAAVTMTPTALKIMAIKMPQVFPAEKNLIKAFLMDEAKNAYGEMKGQVVWQGGVGRVRGKGEGGFRGTLDTDGSCHIYVDHSNILHGLLHHLYAYPSDALPPRHMRTLSLPALSLLLRRGRPTPPGSLHLVASSPLHQNLDPLVRLGWEVSVLKRVELFEDEVEDPTSMKTAARPQARISGLNDVGLRRYKEQGVDEILHLKILQVLNQKGNSIEKGRTLVLATGDARGGQFNRDGFPGAVREALKRGWNVELWSFSAGLSRAWKDTARRERWHELGKFTICALDDWAEQLVEVGEDPDA